MNIDSDVALISFDTISDTNEKIYADFSFLSNSDSENPSTNRELWGEYQQQPLCQIEWSRQVEIAAIAAANTPDPRPPDKSDMRPHVRDRRSDLWIMLDSGAAISIWPGRSYPDLPRPQTSLVAVNGTRIDTYGTRDISLDLEGKQYTHRFIIAEVQSPILGWDFMAHFKLDLHWKRSQCF